MLEDAAGLTGERRAKQTLSNGTLSLTHALLYLSDFTARNNPRACRRLSRAMPVRPGASPAKLVLRLKAKEMQFTPGKSGALCARTNSLKTYAFLKSV